MFVDWLIARAKRTPYYHLDGYMNRWWLVPYRGEVARTVYPLSDQPNVAARTFDGTGPVPFWRRPIAWLLQRFDIAVRVHEILRSDLERHPHSHPWSYLTIILRGGYLEERYDADGDLISYRFHGPGSILWRPAGSLHRLKLDAPVTTLFITGPKRGSWGFQVDGEIINHREYLK